MRLVSEIKLFKWLKKIIDLDWNIYKVCLRNYRELLCVDFGYLIVLEILEYYDWYVVDIEFFFCNVNFFW